MNANRYKKMHKCACAKSTSWWKRRLAPPFSYILHDPWLSSPFTLLTPYPTIPFCSVFFFLPVCSGPLIPQKLLASSDSCSWTWMHIRNGLGCASVAKLRPHRRILSPDVTRRFHLRQESAFQFNGKLSRPAQLSARSLFVRQISAVDLWFVR